MGNQSSVLPGVVPEDVKLETYKVALVGPPTVGKSCIFKRYISTKFKEHYEPDLTANIGAKFVGIDGLPTINLELWDIPGGLDSHLEDVYFENLDGVVLVFDVANAKQSNEECLAWFERIVAYEQRNELPPIPKVKFGNKRDLIHGVQWHHFDTSKAPSRTNRSAKYQSFATCPSFTVSAKDFGGLHSAFKQLIAEVYNNKHPLPAGVGSPTAATGSGGNFSASANSPKDDVPSSSGTDKETKSGDVATDDGPKN